MVCILRKQGCKIQSNNFVFQLIRSYHVLAELGVLSWRLDADNYETDEELKKIREERGYSYMVCGDLSNSIHNIMPHFDWPW